MSATVARYYHTARTAHLERLKEFTPSDFFYTETRADFDLSVLDGEAVVRRVTLMRMLVTLWTRDYTLLEVPEPMAIRNWPQLFLISLTLRLKAVILRRRTSLVTYCIENFPVDEKLKVFTKLPRATASILAKVATSVLLRSMSRVVYGTSGAEGNYMTQTFDWAWRTPHSKLIEALPSPRKEVESARKYAFVFLGTFEPRKGFDILTTVWPDVKREIPDASLLLMGKGELIEEARRLAQRREVTLYEDPSRELIWENLAASRTLILPSQPAPGFREQVGLPVVEGLASGCRIVTSDESGISTWLRQNGHITLPPLSPLSQWVRAMVSSERSGPGPREVLSSLPTQDGRLAADAFLTGIKDQA